MFGWGSGWGLVWSSVWGSIWGLVCGSVVVFGKGLEESYSFELHFPARIASDANGLPGTLDTIPILNTSVWKYLLAGRSMLVLGTLPSVAGENTGNWEM